MFQRNRAAIAAAISRRNEGLRAAYKPTDGYYAGLSGDRHIVTLPDGSTIYGKLISTGSVGIGDRVAVSRDRGSTLAHFDVLPR
jgi:hypothetical protein